MQGIKNLTHGPINRQLFNLAMPIMATSFIQMAYSLTDMAWAGCFLRSPILSSAFMSWKNISLPTPSCLYGWAWE